VGTLSAEAGAFLQAQRVVRLATVDEVGQPHVVPICFAVVDGCIYTVIDRKPKRTPGRALRRVRNILANPRVAVLADEYDEDWSRLAWLQVHGTARLVQDPAARERALAELRRRYAQYREMELADAPLIRIEPVHVISWSASSLA